MEWIDEVTGSHRVMRGGSLWLREETLRSTYHSSYNPLIGGSSLGPISVVPLPAAAYLFATGLIGLSVQ